MSDIKLPAKKREITTKGAVNQARKQGYVPGIFYSKGVEPISIITAELALKPVVYTSETHLINLEIEGQEAVRCILKDVQFDPVSDRIIHFDLYGVTVGQVLQIQVPVQIIGNAVGIKEGGKLQVQMHKIDVECLPKDIPDHIELDVTNLGVGDSIHAIDIKIENVTIITPEDVVIVTVAAPKVVAEDTAEGVAKDSAEPEVIGKSKTEEDKG
ncbi:MAG: 50S ribosomal protein L25 [Ignavibacteria bacterium GWB2_35_6b]|nr:MAG: 50S ribosomal protein L25 [Ignavibacteria bacterium GWB2_35_6b]